MKQKERIQAILDRLDEEYGTEPAHAEELCVELLHVSRPPMIENKKNPAQDRSCAGFFLCGKRAAAV